MFSARCKGDENAYTSVMQAQDAIFQSYLRGEVDIAGKRYEQSIEKMFALTGGPNIQPGPDLLDATEVLSENLRLYAGALRRMANFAVY